MHEVLHDRSLSIDLRFPRTKNARFRNSIRSQGLGHWKHSHAPGTSSMRMNTNSLYATRASRELGKESCEALDIASRSSAGNQYYGLEHLVSDLVFENCMLMGDKYNRTCQTDLNALILSCQRIVLLGLR